MARFAELTVNQDGETGIAWTEDGLVRGGVVPVPGGGDAAEADNTITRESPFAAWMEVYEDGEKLFDVYALTWFPENGEWLVRQGNPERAVLLKPGEPVWRFRNSDTIRVTATIPDHYRLEARLTARGALQGLYGWIPRFEIL